jgi:alpha-methylacyl-CoA racemase
VKTPPQIPEYPIGDMAGRMFAALSILGALCSRELSNTGSEYLDIAMTDVELSLSQSVTYGALTGDSPRPGETSLTGGVPWYDVYETADGRYVTLAALEPKFWVSFCEAVGHEELIDEHSLTIRRFTKRSVKPSKTSSPARLKRNGKTNSALSTRRLDR